MIQAKNTHSITPARATELIGRIERHLRFRDMLLRNPALRPRYQALEQSLACRDWPDMDSRAAAKTDFVEKSIRDCASDQVPDDYVALGPAVTFGPANKVFQRDVPFTLPVNPAAMPDANADATLPNPPPTTAKVLAATLPLPPDTTP